MMEPEEKAAEEEEGFRLSSNAVPIDLSARLSPYAQLRTELKKIQFGIEIRESIISRRNDETN